MKLSPKFLTIILHGLLLFHISPSLCGQQESDELFNLPIPNIEGIPFIMVTIIDEVSEYDAYEAHTRERILKQAFKKALDNAKVPYAYSISFQRQPRPQYVPELQLEIVEWRYSDTSAFVCSIDGTYYDSADKLHDLKGAFGTEMTLNMSGHKDDIEEFMENAAAKAMQTHIKRIYKKGLYRRP